MTGQLNLFRQLPDKPTAPKATESEDKPPRRTQLTQLPGTTFEHIFAGPPSRTRNAA